MSKEKITDMYRRKRPEADNSDKEQMYQNYVKLMNDYAAATNEKTINGRTPKKVLTDNADKAKNRIRTGQQQGWENNNDFLTMDKVRKAKKTTNADRLLKKGN